jgi:hypothetical protein
MQAGFTGGRRLVRSNGPAGALADSAALASTRIASFVFMAGKLWRGSAGLQVALSVFGGRRLKTC